MTREIGMKSFSAEKKTQDQLEDYAIEMEVKMSGCIKHMKDKEEK